MISLKEKIDVQLNKYKVSKNDKYLKICMYNLLAMYIQEPSMGVLKDLKQIVNKARRDIGFDEYIKTFEVLLLVLEKKELNYAFFEKNKRFYKNLYTKNKDKQYLIYLFFKAIEAENKGEKALELLGEYVHNDGLASVLIACSFYLDEDMANMYEHIYLAYLHGNNSILLYIMLNEYYKNENNKDKYNLLGKYLVWAMVHNIDIDKTINYHFESIKIKSEKDFATYFKIYNYTKNIHLLQEIVSSYISHNIEVDENVFELFTEAYNRQLNIHKLNDAIISNAVKFYYTNISNYSFNEYIENGHIKEDEKEYIYHLLIVRHSLSENLPDYSEEIFKYGKRAIENNRQGTYLYSIYKFILLNHRDKLYKQEVNFIEKVLFENLFKYKVVIKNNTNYKPKVLWLKNEEFEDGDIYFIEKDFVEVYSLNKDFKPVFFDMGKKNVLNTEYTIQKTLSGDNKELIKYFYEKGLKSDFLVVSYVLDLINEERYEYIEVYKDALNIKISSNFKNSVNNIVGIYYFKQENPINALKYLENTHIVNKDLGNILIETYIEVEDYNKACEILIRFYKDIEIEHIAKFINLLIGHEVEYNLSEVVYFIMLENVSNDKMLKYLVDNYFGELQEYKSIFKALQNNNDKEVLAKKIIEQYINKKLLSSNKKDLIFLTKALEFLVDYETIKDFCHYVSYEIIVNNFVLTRELIYICENFVLEKNMHILSVALSKSYITNKTENMSKIIDIALGIMHKNNVVLPYFKEIDYCQKIEFINKYNSVLFFNNNKEDLLLIASKNSYSMKYLGLGIYFYTFSCFYGESFKYKIVNKYGETLEQESFKNEKLFISEKEDIYFKINNALIYKKQHKFDLLEKELCWLEEEKDNDFIIM